MVDTIAALCHPKVVHIHLPVGCSQYSQQQLAVSGAGSDEWRHMPASWFLTAHRWLDKAVLRKCSFIRDKMHAFSFHFIKIRNIASNMGDIEVLNNTATCSSENRSAGHETAMLPDKRDFSRVSWRTITRGGREQLAPWRLCDETSLTLCGAEVRSASFKLRAHPQSSWELCDKRCLHAGRPAVGRSLLSPPCMAITHARGHKG